MLTGSGSTYSIDLSTVTSSAGNPVLGNYVLTLNVSDIQGFVLRGYNFPFARYLLLELSGPKPGRQFVGQIIAHITTGEAAPYAEEVAGALAGAGLRAVTDTGNETINYKVREHSLAKVPLMLVVGRREAEQRSVSLRRLGSPAQEALALGDAIARLKVEAVPPDQR